MRMKTNTNQTDSTDLSCKELVKFYFYASIADVYHINLPALRRQICQKFQLTDQQLSDMIAERSEKWSQQIEKAENLIRDSYYTDQFIRNLDKKGCTWKISKSNVRDLMACYLALVLQNVSALTFANHTKKKDIILLLNLLEDDEQLHRFAKPLTETWPPILMSICCTFSPISAFLPGTIWILSAVTKEVWSWTDRSSAI